MSSDETYTEFIDFYKLQENSPVTYDDVLEFARATIIPVLKNGKRFFVTKNFYRTPKGSEELLYQTLRPNEIYNGLFIEIKIKTDDGELITTTIGKVIKKFVKKGLIKFTACVAEFAR